MAWYDVTGTIADWFSFTANAGTLVLTIIIAIKAKKILDDKVQSEGLTRGYKILDAIDEIYDVMPHLVEGIIHNRKTLKIAATPSENFEGYSLDSILNNASKIRSNASDLKNKVMKVSNMIKRLERWHISLFHKKDFDIFIQISTNLLEDIIYIASYNAEFTYPDSEFNYNVVHKLESLLIVYKEGIDESYNTILSYKFKDIFLEL